MFSTSFPVLLQVFPHTYVDHLISPISSPPLFYSKKTKE